MARNEVMKIAVEGCCHGELDKIYETLQFLEEKDQIKIDLLLICGDFQAVRNRDDLSCMAVSAKYQKMNTFYKYYSGEKKAPILTVFIGGNHEASNYLQELPYGGWVAPNIYYMGYANVLSFGGVRIGGLSGIFKGKDYNRGHHERPPYNEETKRSAYHIRNVDVFRLKQLSTHVDILMSHDWPMGMWKYGDANYLLKKKPFFKEDIEAERLGSPPAAEILHKLKPDYWFSAHLHVKFAANVEHEMKDGSKRTTKFLSLDKCLPRRQFLQIIDIPHDNNKPLELGLDPEWLSILKSTNHLLGVSRQVKFMPGPGSSERWDYTTTTEELEAIKADFGGMFNIPENFEKTAPIFDGDHRRYPKPPPICINPQTTLLCQMLGLTDPNAVFLGKDTSLNFSICEQGSPGSPGSDDDVKEEDEGLDTSSCLTPMGRKVESRLSASFSPLSLPKPADTSFSPLSLPKPVNSCSSPLSLPKPADTSFSPLCLPKPANLDTSAADSSFGSLSLAKPVNPLDSDTSAESGVSSVLNDSAEKRKLETSASISNDSLLSASTDSPVNKKFKRRNQAVYQDEEV